MQAGHSSDGSAPAKGPSVDRRVVVGGLVAVLACVVALLVINRPGHSGASVESRSGVTRIAGHASAVASASRPVDSPSTTIRSTTTTPTITTSAPPSTPGRVGVFVPAPGPSAVVGTGRLVTYTVEVEEAVGENPAEVGAIVDAALTDPRGWTADGAISFQRVETGGQVRIVLATPATVDKLCLPLRTNGVFSCRHGQQMNLNADRWRNGTDQWPLGVDEYRAHVVNHEMGHTLGHGHKGCPGPGQLAPVMMQQTKGLHGCVANVWPYPDRAPG